MEEINQWAGMLRNWYRIAAGLYLDYSYLSFTFPFWNRYEKIFIKLVRYNAKIVYIGTILSGVFSTLLISLSGMEALGWSFKPFTAHSLIAAITFVALLIQAVIVHVFATKDSRSKV